MFNKTPVVGEWVTFKGDVSLEDVDLYKPVGEVIKVDDVAATVKLTISTGRANSPHGGEYEDFFDVPMDERNEWLEGYEWVDED